jgi:hypothetical protein
MIQQEGDEMENILFSGALRGAGIAEKTYRTRKQRSCSDGEGWEPL